MQLSPPSLGPSSMAVDDRGADKDEQHTEYGADRNGQDCVRVSRLMHGRQICEVEKVRNTSAGVANSSNGHAESVLDSDVRQLGRDGRKLG